MAPRASRRHRRAVGVGLLGCALVGCAADGGSSDAGPPLLFVRQRGVWVPEELNHDLAECVDRVHPRLLADESLQLGPPGSARAALREQIVACMDERGWSTGSSAEAEEWTE